MNDENVTIILKNQQTGLQTSLLANKDLKVRDILEIDEAIANKYNKTSGNMNDLEIYSKSTNSTINLEDSIGKIFKDIKLDEFHIRNRYSHSLSELQAIPIRIKISYSTMMSEVRIYEFSRFDKLSQIGDVILKQLKKTREQCDLQFLIKGKTFNAFAVNLTLADLNLIDNDEIQIIIPISLQINFIDGSLNSWETYFIKKDTSLLHAVSTAFKSFIGNEEGKQAHLDIEINQKICDQKMCNKTLSDLNLNESSQINVRIRWSGGFQSKGNPY